MKKEMCSLGGAGIDLIKISKVQRFCENRKYLKKVFTPAEIKYCQKKAHQFQHFAARFAAKEAMFKALRAGWDRDQMDRYRGSER